MFRAITSVVQNHWNVLIYGTNMNAGESYCTIYKKNYVCAPETPKFHTYPYKKNVGII